MTQPLHQALVREFRPSQAVDDRAPLTASPGAAALQSPPLFVVAIMMEEADKRAAGYCIDMQLLEAEHDQAARRAAHSALAEAAPQRARLGTVSFEVPGEMQALRGWEDGLETTELFRPLARTDNAMAAEKIEKVGGRHLFVVAMLTVPRGGPMDFQLSMASHWNVRSMREAVDATERAYFLQHPTRELYTNAGLWIPLQTAKVLRGPHGGRVVEVRTPLRGLDGLVEKIVTEKFD